MAESVFSYSLVLQHASGTYLRCEHSCHSQTCALENMKNWRSVWRGLTWVCEQSDVLFSNAGILLILNVTCLFRHNTPIHARRSCKRIFNMISFNSRLNQVLTYSTSRCTLLLLRLAGLSFHSSTLHSELTVVFTPTLFHVDFIHPNIAHCSQFTTSMHPAQRLTAVLF